MMGIVSTQGAQWIRVDFHLHSPGPGHLANNLTIENIKASNSNMRNPILASFAATLLLYRELGSGLLRALRAWPQIELIDGRTGNLFKVIVARPQEQAA